MSLDKLQTAKVPVQIKRLTRTTSDQQKGYALVISWSTGEQSLISSDVLRQNCPCAECRESQGDRSHSTPLTGAPTSRRSSLLRVIDATAGDETDLVAIWPVGNYAIGLRFADKHDSGIYSYTFLASLADQTPTS